MAGSFVALPVLTDAHAQSSRVSPAAIVIALQAVLVLAAPFRLSVPLRLMRRRVDSIVGEKGALGVSV
jgi:hypothetical protein